MFHALLTGVRGLNLEIIPPRLTLIVFEVRHGLDFNMTQVEFGVGRNISPVFSCTSYSVNTHYLTMVFEFVNLKRTLEWSCMQFHSANPKTNE